MDKAPERGDMVTDKKEGFAWFVLSINLKGYVKLVRVHGEWKTFDHYLDADPSTIDDWSGGSKLDTLHYSNLKSLGEFGKIGSES